MGGGQGGLGSALNCGQGSPGTTSGSGGGGVSCVAADVNATEASDWRGAQSIAALRRRASDSQPYSPQQPQPPHYTQDMEYNSSVYSCASDLAGVRIYEDKFHRENA